MLEPQRAALLARGCHIDTCNFDLLEALGAPGPIVVAVEETLCVVLNVDLLLLL